MSIIVVVGDCAGKWVVSSDGRDFEGGVVVTEQCVKHIVMGNVIVGCTGNADVSDEVLHSLLADYKSSGHAPILGLIVHYVNTVQERLGVTFSKQEGFPRNATFACFAVFEGDPIIYDVCPSGGVHRVNAQRYAIGSGREAALGVLAITECKLDESSLRAAAIRAVTAACMTNMYCGGDIHTDSIGWFEPTVQPEQQTILEKTGLSPKEFLDFKSSISPYVTLEEALAVTAKNLNLSVEDIMRKAYIVKTNMEPATVHGGGYFARWVVETFLPDPTVLKPPFKLTSY